MLKTVLRLKSSNRKVNQMKFEDVKIGQILEDVYGNKFEVIGISNKVMVKCIEFKKSVRVDPYTTLAGLLTGVNQTLWILKDFSMLLPIHEGFGKFIKDNFYSSLALSGNLESITVDICGIKRDYILAQQSTIDKIKIITLTLSEMKIVEDAENVCTTKDFQIVKETKTKLEDVSIGMEVVDKLGNEYIIIALDSTEMPVKLKCTKLKNKCFVDDKTMFVSEGDEWWIVDSEKNYKEFSEFDVDISLESIKQKA